VKSFFSKNRTILILATVVLVALAAVLQFTEVCRLKAVTLDGKPLYNWQGRFGLSAAKLVTDQPVDLLATELLGSNDVVKVSVDYSLPGTVRIRTNDYTAVAFLVDRTLGQIWGLDQSGRIVPLKNSHTDWEHPFLTGLVAGRVYGGCEDLRVSVVLAQLERLASDQQSVYRLIDEINFGPSDYLVVKIDGVSAPIKVTPESLARQIGGVVEFVHKYNPDLTDALMLDSRFGSLVIKDCVPDTTKKDTTRQSRVVEALD
jgi:hypothetical protein